MRRVCIEAARPASVGWRPVARWGLGSTAALKALLYVAPRGLYSGDRGEVADVGLNRVAVG
jgi:hypothetical protein